jgi:hypothetical protein
MLRTLVYIVAIMCALVSTEQMGYYLFMYRLVKDTTIENKPSYARNEQACKGWFSIWFGSAVFFLVCILGLCILHF